jgi:hypothetical protein
MGQINQSNVFAQELKKITPEIDQRLVTGVPMMLY